ncbi:hypothetical protein G6F50_013393 [Rhizopus delemar]|uniref:Sulfatase-modifying factor enzyme domain-containing protein n=1 Tax=Rhizopus delemar TaxID=936053 RepID=A0A9P6YIU8_9FUNG|nr:hypothetical protein G6F50_013393 [Rhizopus delemar]
MRQKIKEYGIKPDHLFGPDLSDLVRYRHPETGQTWNGIGRPPNWIRGKDRHAFSSPSAFAECIPIQRDKQVVIPKRRRTGAPFRFHSSTEGHVKQQQKVGLMIAGVLGGASALGAYVAGVSLAPKPAAVVAKLGDGKQGPAGMAWIPPAEFLMGNNHKLSQPNELPPHSVRVSGFWMDTHDVTNAEFRRFVEATGYVTTAEQKPKWEDLKVQLPPGTPRPDDSLLVPGAMVFVGSESEVSLRDYTRWWRCVPGASLVRGRAGLRKVGG